MKKNKNKGFLLTELLVTATIVSTVLIFLYTQFFSVKRGYENSFVYNSVNDLYALDNMRSYLIDSGYIDKYVDMIDKNEVHVTREPYYHLVDIDSDFLITDQYFNQLKNMLNIKNLYITKNNLLILKTYLNRPSSNISSQLEQFKKFINYIDFDKNSDSGYRLIAEFDNTNGVDNSQEYIVQNAVTFATLLIGGDE